MSTESAISLDSFETVVIGTAFWFSTAMRQRGERLIKAGKRKGWVFFLSEKTLITRLQCESGGLRRGGGRRTETGTGGIAADRNLSD